MMADGVELRDLAPSFRGSQDLAAGLANRDPGVRPFSPAPSERRRQLDPRESPYGHNRMFREPAPCSIGPGIDDEQRKESVDVVDQEEVDGPVLGAEFGGSVVTDGA